MRVNVDDKAHADPRFDRAGGQLKMNRHEVLGRCILVWNFAYQSRSAIMSARDVDALSQCKGFAKAMIAVDLAQPKRDKVRLRGVDERIEFLLIQDAKRAKANEKRAELALLRDVPPGNVSDENARRKPRSRGKSPGQGPYSPDQTATAAAAQDPSRTPEQAAQLPEAIVLSSLPLSPDGLKPSARGAAAREIRNAIADGVSAEECQQAAAEAIEKLGPFKNAGHLDRGIASFVRKVHEDAAGEGASGWESPL